MIRLTLVILVGILLGCFTGVHTVLEAVGALTLALVVTNVVRGLYLGSLRECPGCPGCYCDGEHATGPGHHPPGRGSAA